MARGTLGRVTTLLPAHGRLSQIARYQQGSQEHDRGALGDACCHDRLRVVARLHEAEQWRALAYVQEHERGSGLGDSDQPAWRTPRGDPASVLSSGCQRKQLTAFRYRRRRGPRALLVFRAKRGRGTGAAADESVAYPRKRAFPPRRCRLSQGTSRGSVNSGGARCCFAREAPAESVRSCERGVLRVS
jgi:hypothetical protein